MALIKSAGYDGLSELSTDTASRKPGKFFNVFICGELRKDEKTGTTQKPGTMQCTTAFTGGDFLINNQDEVWFIPLFIKKYWARYQTVKDNNGKDYERLIEFSWDEKAAKTSPDCKFEYVVAGYLWNTETKSIVKHPKALEENGIAEGDSVMVFFKCAKTRCGCGMDLLNRIADKAKALPPLSDNPEFERTVVAIRRFLIKTTIVIKPTAHRSVAVYDFVPTTLLGDKTVADIIEKANALTKDFEYQFNKVVRTGGTGGAKTEGSGLETFDGAASDNNQVSDVPDSSTNFEIDI